MGCYQERRFRRKHKADHAGEMLTMTGVLMQSGMHQPFVLHESP